MIDLDRFRGGDPPYFRDLVKEYGVLVMGICIRHASSEDEVEEHFQLVWSRIWAKRDSFRGEGMFEAWVARVARSVCLDTKDAAAAKRRAYSHFERSGGPRDLHWTPRNPDEDAQVAEDRDALLEALDRLPQQQRKAVVLKYFEDRTDEEAARIMGVAEATVRSTVRDGKKNLRRFLKGRY